MSEIKVDKISPQSGTALAIGDSGDTITIPSGATITNSGTANGFGGGKVLQVVHTDFGTLAQTTTQMTSNNTINTSSEGAEFLSLAITPAHASNKLVIQVVMHCSHNHANNFISVNLFQDSTANAIALIGCIMERVANDMHTVVGSHYMTAGTTSATTFKVRAGGNNTGTFSVNGMITQYYGGTALTGMTIWELSA